LRSRAAHHFAIQGRHELAFGYQVQRQLAQWMMVQKLKQALAWRLFVNHLLGLAIYIFYLLHVVDVLCLYLSNASV
jgi:hypothetical protein